MVFLFAAGRFAREQFNGSVPILQPNLQLTYGCRTGEGIFREVVSYDSDRLDLLFATLRVGPYTASSCPHYFWDCNAHFFPLPDFFPLAEFFFLRDFFVPPDFFAPDFFLPFRNGWDFHFRNLRNASIVQYDWRTCNFYDPHLTEYS